MQLTVSPTTQSGTSAINGFANKPIRNETRNGFADLENYVADGVPHQRPVVDRVGEVDEELCNQATDQRSSQSIDRPINNQPIK